MRRSSLRTWLLLLSILFAVLTVGGISLTSYAVVSEGMVAVTRERVERVAASAERIVGLQVESARDADGDSRIPYLVERLDLVYGGRGPTEPQIALYDARLEPMWGSSDSAFMQTDSTGRSTALEEGRTVWFTLEEASPLRGLFRTAILPVQIAHIPMGLPDGSVGVMDVTYFPMREEQVIDAVRPPMFALAVSAMFIMVVMMQASMGWVLRLVDDLRRAAESVDAGRLDVRLPDEGEHEIGELARSINALIDRLRRKSEAQTRFIADASHELATPVAGIRGYTNILRAWGADDPEVREEAIAAIDRESRRMARLCSDLLALVRDERAIVYRRARFDLNVRCRETLAAAATRYMDKGLEFVGPDEGQLIMVGDPDRIEDAISILVDNAAKYTQSGVVTLKTRRKRDTVIIEVIDTGIGIPAEDIPSIFERFYRSDASRSQETGGFGLGLPIATTIVEGAGGSISVESEVGVGSRFIIRLPRGRI
ncbi:MAG: HAMP domain-containing sensor histidine kinase [Coriobacteriia bacterium]|nr:HAMP domain-containing sensor histidine kinase [Coriobacteriia bacterium]